MNKTERREKTNHNTDKNRWKIKRFSNITIQPSEKNHSAIEVNQAVIPISKKREVLD
jgi:hypothetical protein